MKLHKAKEIVLFTVWSTFVVAAAFVAFAVVGYMLQAMLGIFVDRQTNHTCETLQQQAEDFKDVGFYITEKEAELCRGYQIDAPVARRPLSDQPMTSHE